jgi:hypothetical protein
MPTPVRHRLGSRGMDARLTWGMNRGVYRDWLLHDPMGVSAAPAEGLAPLGVRRFSLRDARGHALKRKVIPPSERLHWRAPSIDGGDPITGRAGGQHHRR